MMKLYMARHGETDLNNKNVYYGWTDIKLTSNGELQCTQLKGKLKDFKFDVVISSPLERALKSAQIISGINIVNIVKMDNLKEMNFGNWEEMNYLDVKSKYSDDWQSWTDDWQGFCIPGGESFNMLYQRVKKALNEITKKYSGKSLLLVGHEGTLRIIALILLNMKSEDYWKFSFEFGKYSHFEIQEDITIIRKVNC